MSDVENEPEGYKYLPGSDFSYERTKAVYGGGLKVLVGCECSGRVRRAFRGRGHDAWSCDLKPVEDNSMWHLQRDVFGAILDRSWDLVILHPECTAMCVSGNKHYAKDMPKHQLRLDAVDWTIGLWRAACREAPMVAMENPSSVLFPHLRRIGADVQYIQPHNFGIPEFKTTGLALHGLDRLAPTNQLAIPGKGSEMYKEWERVFRMPPSPERATERSRTYLGIADAMAEQWGGS